jgi:hypothetical protein
MEKFLLLDKMGHYQLFLKEDELAEFIISEAIHKYADDMDYYINAFENFDIKDYCDCFVVIKEDFEKVPERLKKAINSHLIDEMADCMKFDLTELIKDMRDSMAYDKQNIKDRIDFHLKEAEKLKEQLRVLK